MKKYLLVICALLISTYCFADKHLKVKKGNTDCLKQTSVALIEFDFSNTTWEKDEDFKEWCGKDYEKRIKRMKKGFVKVFNDVSSGMSVTTDADESAEYKLIFKVEDLERHQAFWGTWGQGKFYVTGTITIINIKTNETVCLINIDSFGSGKDFNYEDGFSECFEGLAKSILKLK